MPMNNKSKNKKPWPTKDAMTQIYENKMWGGGSFDFYSGEGSHKEELVKPYVVAVQSFLKSFSNPISICDVGCGDFNVGKEFLGLASKYFAVDIVDSLIVRNKQKFAGEKVEFKCLDIAVDDLPNADCVLIRQVLQHLSNNEIQNILNKVTKYKYIILTEHIPNGAFTSNIDIISGQGIRLKKNSGLDILAAPFHFKIKEKRELLSLDLGQKKGRIRTVLYTTA